MSLQRRLRRAAKVSHETCDGRFCGLDEHPEIEAIKVIKQQAAEIKRLKAWCDKAYDAQPNIDLDIKALYGGE